MTIEQFTHKGHSIKIEYDHDPENPRDDDNLGVMICWNRRNPHGDKHKFSNSEPFFLTLLDNETAEQLENWREVASLLADYTQDEVIDEAYSAMLHEAAIKQVILLSLHFYEHGGVTVRAGDPECGSEGYIYMTLKDAEKEFDGDREKALSCLKQEVKTYAEYLEGSVYGYVIENADGDEVDSCWGFYGLEVCKTQAMENVPS